VTDYFYRDNFNPLLVLTSLVGLIAFGSPDRFVISPRVHNSEFKATYQSFGTLTIAATVTKSMGLPADPQLSWFLHLHLDYFILT
jgi:hypothetical protein